MSVEEKCAAEAMLTFMHAHRLRLSSIVEYYVLTPGIMTSFRDHAEMAAWVGYNLSYLQGLRLQKVEKQSVNDMTGENVGENLLFTLV